LQILEITHHKTLFCLGVHHTRNYSNSNHIHKRPNRHYAYEENINYGERDVEAFNLIKKVELPLEKKYVQPQLLVLTTTQVEEQPSPPPPLPITTEIKNNDDPFEEKDEVEDDSLEEIVAEMFVVVDEKEKLCLSAIYKDFSMYLSVEESHTPCPKKKKKTRGQVFF
jgi:hypothetical protein